MEGLIILIILLVLVAPLIFSIVALVKVAQLQTQVDRLRRALPEQGEPHVSVQGAEASAPARIASETTLEPSAPTAIPATVGEQARSAPKPSSNQPAARKRRTQPLELLMGARASAFVGIAILVIGISLLIAYAIQNAWMGPGARCLLGVLSGVVLITLGYVGECRSANYRLLARVLTGGGGALFFVSVYAAFGMYHLIPPMLAGAALLTCAAAVFALAKVYRSQAVAILGVIGAFLIPVLIRDDVQHPTFLLAYVALLNLPVIAFGLWRKWQWLYNLAFLCTAAYFLEWMDHSRSAPLLTGLGFSLLYFLQYAALGLLKLWKESDVSGRVLDSLRLLLASALLLWAVHGLLENRPAGQWMGAWFVGYAAMHVGIAWIGFRRFPHFTQEILALLAGATLFAALALPVQLDGAWVSAGWAIEGVILAWMAKRTRSAWFQLLGGVLGLIGILKGLTFDHSLYTHPPGAFLNLRFGVGMLAALLLGLQGWMARNAGMDWKASPWNAGFAWVAVVSALVMAGSDAFWTIGIDSILAWAVVAWVMLAAGGFLFLGIPEGAGLRKLGSWLLIAVPLWVWFFGWTFARDLVSPGPFLHGWIWFELATVGIAAGLWFYCGNRLTPEGEGDTTVASHARAAPGTWMLLLSITVGVALVSGELLRASERWGSMAMSLFWALAAVVLILLGLSRQHKPLRYLGLALVALCAGKVILVDSTQLEGLARIGAYIGSGVLLLLLSFLYQKASLHFKDQDCP